MLLSTVANVSMPHAIGLYKQSQCVYNLRVASSRTDEDTQWSLNSEDDYAVR